MPEQRNSSKFSRKQARTQSNFFINTSKSSSKLTVAIRITIKTHLQDTGYCQRKQLVENETSRTNHG